MLRHISGLEGWRIVHAKTGVARLVTVMLVGSDVRKRPSELLSSIFISEPQIRRMVCIAKSAVFEDLGKTLTRCN